MPLIDTLTLKTDLLDGGMPEPQASAIVKALANADVGQLATKADIADVRTEIEALRSEMNAKIEALGGEIRLLRSEMNAGWVASSLPFRCWCSASCPSRKRSAFPLFPKLPGNPSTGIAQCA